MNERVRRPASRGFAALSLAAGAACLAAGAAPLAAEAAQAAIDPHLLVTVSNDARGDLAALGLTPPFAAAVDLEPAGVDATVRHFFGRHYVVSPATGRIQVVDPATFDTILQFSVGRDSEPHDILVVDPSTAYVTRYNETLLYKVDPSTGERTGTIDLGLFSDADGTPEMSMMSLDRDRLFVQIQRVDRLLSGNPIPPSWLAVVDVTNDQLIDVDPVTPGIQGIRLRGTNPGHKMHHDATARRLFVSVPGVRLDAAGGIEEIDLDRLTSLGFILAEEDSIGDLSAFVMVTRDRGYVLGHTDIVQSSHLLTFSRGGPPGTELHVTFDLVRSLAHDAASGLLFFPDPAPSGSGILIIDTATDEILEPSPVGTGLPPRDLAVARDTTPGEATDLRVTGFDPATGDLSLSYRPACGASDHNLVYGPLDEVGSYGYSGQVCGIGAGGVFDRFNPGSGSFFFLVVGTDGIAREGSYGGDGRRTERPEDPLDPICSFDRDLSFSCDAR